MRVELGMTVAPATTTAASMNVAQVAAMFGLGIERQQRMTVVPRTLLELGRAELVFVTGPSGGGKSTLLRLIGHAAGQTTRAADECGITEQSPHAEDHMQIVARRVDDDNAAPIPVVDFAHTAAEHDRALVDSFGDAPFEDVLRWLSMAGLNDAFVMLRRPGELSDGQRYRLRLAQVMGEVAQRGDADGLAAVVLADEFGATLDRQTARVVAKNVRKWVSATGVCFVAATTHDDLLEALEPDVLIEKGFGPGIEVVKRGAIPSNHEDAKNTKDEE